MNSNVDQISFYTYYFSKCTIVSNLINFTEFIPTKIYNITGLAFRGHRNESLRIIDLEQNYYRSEANEGHSI